METLAPKAAPPETYRPIDLMPVDLSIEHRDDGTILLRTQIPIGEVDANLPRRFAETAMQMGDAPAIAIRDQAGVWVRTSYAALKRDVDAAAGWLVDHRARGRAVIVIGGNSLATATLQFATNAAGAIHCPISPAYAMAGGDYARLRHVLRKTWPAIIYADAHPAIAKAVADTVGSDVIVVTPDLSMFDRPTVAWADVVAGDHDRIANTARFEPEAVASYMLTSGSTGLPKIVPQTFSAIAVTAKQGEVTLGPDITSGTMLDWMPWHHVAGSGMLRSTLMRGGTLHVDGGKPAPGLFDETIRNLREIPLRFFFNVPLGYAMLADALDADPVLRRTFFSEMRLMLYGGAGLPQHVSDRLQKHALAETGHRILMSTGYGMTETVAGCMTIHFPTEKVGIGLPAPALDVKLVPHDDRFELRLRGPSVMRGYLDEPEKNAAAFDEEGYYRTGDLAVFHDDADPDQGLAFAGRLAEEFKLSSGTWVYGGQLREALLRALAPLVTDLVLCDDDRDYLTILAWAAPSAPDDVLTVLVERLRAFNVCQHGTSATVRRIRLLTRLPNIDAHEVSDKGTINRRAVINNRSDDVTALYAEQPDADVGVI